MTTMCSARLSADECAAKMRVENWAAGSCVEKKLSIWSPVADKKR